MLTFGLAKNIVLMNFIFSHVRRGLDANVEKRHKASTSDGNGYSVGYIFTDTHVASVDSTNS